MNLGKSFTISELQNQLLTSTLFCDRKDQVKYHLKFLILKVECLFLTLLNCMWFNFSLTYSLICSVIFNSNQFLKICPCVLYSNITQCPAHKSKRWTVILVSERQSRIQLYLQWGKDGKKKSVLSGPTVLFHGPKNILKQSQGIYRFQYLYL